MNVIAIYHQPQECGEPYVALISQETGEMVETVTIPTGYYNSGTRMVETLNPVYNFIEQIEQSPYPTVDNVRISAGFRQNPKHYVFRVTKVDNIQEDTDFYPTWKADVHIEACKKETHWEYDPAKDEFLKQLTEEGLDVSDWGINKRQKTEFKVFLREILSSYKDYNIINLIEIG